MTYLLIYYIIFTITTCVIEAGVKINDITTEFVEEIINDNFRECKKKPLISSNNNISSIFNNGNKLFEIRTDHTIIEKDFSGNTPKKFFLKYYDKNNKEIINLKSNQAYYYKKKNLILFIGDIHIKSITDNVDVYTDCLIYDIDNDAFFNTHTTNIETKKTKINGTKLYLKRDLSHMKLSLNYINHKYTL